MPWVIAMLITLNKELYGVLFPKTTYVYILRPDIQSRYSYEMESVEYNPPLCLAW